LRRGLIWTIAAVLVCFGLVLFLRQGRTAAPKRIVLVTIDTLRADHLRSYGYPRETAPFIEELIEKGVLFTHAFSAASHTAPSHATIFTSLYPFEHQLLRNQEELNPALYNLYKLLTERGISATAFPAVNFLDGKVGFPPAPPLPAGAEPNLRRHWYRNAEEIVSWAIAGLSRNSRDDRFFVWLHFYDVHQWQGRGHLPDRYWQMMERSGDASLISFLEQRHNTPMSFFGGSEGILKAVNGYDARVRFVDEELRRFNSFLDRKGWAEGTLWVILSDHGEGLGNHNYAGHGECLYQEQLHIPLIFSRPDGRLDPRIVNDLVRTVDLLPTFAQLYGVDLKRRASNLRGTSLLALLDGGGWDEKRPAYSFAQRRPKDNESFRRTWEEGNIYSIHSKEWKLIDHSLDRDELFNLDRDTFETNDLSDSHFASEQRLRDELSRIIENAAPVPDEKDSAEMAPGELEELKSLGYL
jgi:arylsulfatase A-like enzyme